MWILLACSRAPLGDDDLQRFRERHAAVYEVFDLAPDRDAIHGQLADSLAGDALTRAYVEHWTLRQRMADEATTARVLDVIYDRVEAVDDTRLAADWRVTAHITHQDHEHVRVNRYQAIYRFEDERITGSWIRNAERLPGEIPAGDEERIPLDELLERL